MAWDTEENKSGEVEKDPLAGDKRYLSHSSILSVDIPMKKKKPKEGSEDIEELSSSEDEKAADQLSPWGKKR